MTFEDKLVKIAEREQKVFEAGQKSMVDESKIIEKTAIGTTTLTIDDVSELPHDVEVQLSSDSITDFSGISLSVNGDMYSSPSDGLIKGIKSYSPNMTFTTDEGLKIEAKYHKSWGMQTEYDRFWDSHQDYGNRKDYSGAFYAWSGENFPPKYDVRPTRAYMMFAGTAPSNQKKIDIVQTEEEADIVFDFSQCTDFQYAFYGSGVYRYGTIDTRSCASFSQFMANPATHIVEKLIFKDDGSQTFYNTKWIFPSYLEHIVIEGKIGHSVHCESAILTKNSIISFINALLETAEGQTLSLRKNAIVNAFGSTTSDEWLNLIATKQNWTISLV